MSEKYQNKCDKLSFLKINFPVKTLKQAQKNENVKRYKI